MKSPSLLDLFFFCTVECRHTTGQGCFCMSYYINAAYHGGALLILGFIFLFFQYQIDLLGF